jgi:hypothetical protein
MLISAWYDQDMCIEDQYSVQCPPFRYPVSDDVDLFLLALMMQLDSTVAEVMSSPAITLTLDKTVLGNFLLHLPYSLHS